MAFRDIPGNPNWEYDDSPPDPGGAQSVLYETGTGGIRTNPRGEEIYMNCRHKTLHPTQESVPNEINKTYWDEFIDFTFLLNNCVLFNDRIVTAKVNGATSSSTTLVIDNNSGNGLIVVGMVVTGTGISGTPTVITVTDQNNLVLSSAQTLSDNTDLTFTGTGSLAFPLFHPKEEEATRYGIIDSSSTESQIEEALRKSYVKNTVGQIIEPQNWPTKDGFKKAIIDSIGNDIGDFSFRGSAGADSDQRTQLRNNSEAALDAAAEVSLEDRFSSTIGENSILQKGRDFKILFIQTRNGTVVRHTNENSAGAVPTYSLISLFNNNHSVPADDGYYVFIFSFGGLQAGTFHADDTRYNLFYAKVH